jgi:hypothetical protein
MALDYGIIFRACCLTFLERTYIVVMYLVLREISSPLSTSDATLKDRFGAPFIFNSTTH